MDVVVGMHGSIYDFCVLKRSSIYHQCMAKTLFLKGVTHKGFLPYVITDLGYLLLPKLFIPY